MNNLLRNTYHWLNCVKSVKKNAKLLLKKETILQMEGFNMKFVATDQAAAAIGPYSQGVIAGNLFYSSGQIPLTPSGEMVEGSIVDQTHQVFANLKAVLAEAGSSLEGVIKTTVFIKDMNDF